MEASFIILYKETKARVSRNKAPPPRRLIFIASNPRRIINRFHQKQILDSFCRVERAGGWQFSTPIIQYFPTFSTVIQFRIARSQPAGSFNVYFSSNQRAARVSILPQLSHIKWKIWSADVVGGRRGGARRGRGRLVGSRRAYATLRRAGRNASNRFIAFLSAPLRYGPYHNTE